LDRESAQRRKSWATETNEGREKKKPKKKGVKQMSRPGWLAHEDKMVNRGTGEGSGHPSRVDFLMSTE